MFSPLSFLSRFVKSHNQRELDRIKKIVLKINSLEDKFKNLDDDDFPKKTLELKKQINNGKKIDEILPEALLL